MTVELKTREMQEPKELSEVFDAVEAVLKAAMSGSDIMTKIMAEVPTLVTAFEGIQKLGDEIKHETVYQSSGAFAGRVARAIIEK